MELRIGMCALLPCSGEVTAGTERGHVYKVKRIYSFKEDGTPRVAFCGYMTRRKASRRYGKENIVISESDSICPPCDRSYCVYDLFSA